MRLKAFSLIEIIVALFLSGIVISAVYSGYVFTHQQFFKFTNIKTDIRSYFEFSEVLNREFETAKKVLKIDDRNITIKIIDRTIAYSFNEEQVVRTTEEHTDTFYIGIETVEMSAFDVAEELLVESLDLTIKENEQTKSLSVYKDYGAVIQIEKEDGDRY